MSFINKGDEPYIKGTRAKWSGKVKFKNVVQTIDETWDFYLVIVDTCERVVFTATYPSSYIYDEDGELVVDLPPAITTDFPAGEPLRFYLKVKGSGANPPVDQPINGQPIVFIDGGPTEDIFND